MTENPETLGLPRRPILASRIANTVRYSLMNLFIIWGTVSIAMGGAWVWMGLITSFVLIGFVDESVGDFAEGEDMPPVWYMNLMLYLTLPLLVIATLVAYNVVSYTGYPFLDAAFRFFGYDPVQSRANMSWFYNGGAFATLGMFYGAAGINVAHELVHRTGKTFDMIVGRWLLAFTFDTGFSIEHVYGHHKHVGTEADPATARRGEYVLIFVARSTFGQIVNAYRIEKDRLKRKGIPDQIWNNRFWRGQAMSVVVLASAYAFLGPRGLLLAFIAGTVGKFYLELVNYVEHYGLVRIPGTRVESRHAWDSYRRVSTGVFYNLQLHSNHHKFATRPYWELKQAPGEAPVMPWGYMTTIFASFVPQLWNHVMNKRLADWDKNYASPEERAYLKDKGLLLG